MLRNCTFYILSITILVSVASCEVPIEIEGDSKLVVQSYFTEEQDLRVFVTETNSRTSGASSIFVENATVTLFLEEDYLQALCFIADADPPYYTTKNFQPEIGKEYLLEVDVPGFMSVTASNSIPEPVDIVDIFYNNSVTPNGDLSEVKFDVVVTIADPKQIENYYHILFTQQLYTIETNPDGTSDTILLDTDNELDLISVSKFIQVDQYYGHPSFLLNDSDFNGSVVEIPFRGTYSYDPLIYKRGEFAIELRTISSAYYEHFQNILLEPEDPLSGIGGIGSNVSNGAGVFAGYSSKKGFKHPN